MALYSKVLSAGGGNYRLDLTVNQGTQSVANNTTSVSWSLVITKTAGSGYWSNNSSSWNVNIGGQTKSGTISSYDFRSYSSLTLGSGSFTIAHNADGTKSISVSGYFNGNIGSGTASGTLALTTIPRASSFGTITGSTIGSAITVNINRASSSFTHSLWYSFGSATWQGGTSGVGTSWTFTPPLTLGNQIPNATSGNLTIILRTMNGSTQIGSDVTKTITVNLPSSVVPSFTTITHSENISTIASTVGAYVKGFSKLNLAITGATGAYGSTIKSYHISFAGHTINASSGTTGIINSNGTLVATGTITDSRGRTASKTVNITVLNYTPPQIVSGNAERTNSAGTLTWNGTYVKYSYNVKVQSLVVGSTEKNGIASLALQYKLTTASSWSTFATLTGALTLNSSNIYTPLAITSSYDVRMVLRDKLGREVVWINRVSSGTIMLDLGENNLGVGKFWEKGTIDAVGQIYQNDGQPVMGQKSLNGYWGMTTENGGDASYIRTTSPGIIPYSSSNPSGASNIGTSTWPFALVSSRQFLGKGVAGNWLAGIEGKAMIVNDVQGSSGSYHPILQIKTPNGNYANVGHINEEFGIYGYKTGRTTNGVDYQFITFNPSNGQIKILGQPLEDYVVDAGTASGWAYRKWNSGRCELWRYDNQKLDINSAWGSIFSSGNRTISAKVYPFTVYDSVVNITASTANSGNPATVWILVNDIGTDTQTPSCELARATANVGNTFKIQYSVAGRWK